MKRAEFLEVMIERYGRDTLDKPLTMRGLVEALELCRALEPTLDTYRPGEMDVPCPECDAVPGHECRASLRGPRLPSPHAGRRALVGSR